ncbi:hypothetical protein A9Q99_25095 [Gammaproteobacteria bacterium 45_16_T64]|nr:hypothetical protein A9Q99_25095 [Gammaproteobacteria bacterium 45_16_T64]
MRSSVLLIILLFMGGTPAYSVQVVEVATYDVLPPYAYRDEEGKLTGLYIEIVKAAVSRMPDYSVDFHVAPWTRVKSLAQFGKVFAVLPPYFHAHDWLTETEPKKPYIWPYSEPLFEQQDVVLCNASVLEEKAYRFPEDFANLLFVNWRGDGRVGEKFHQMVQEKKIILVEVATIKEAIRLVLYGRYDCTVASKLPARWYLSLIKESEEFKKLKNEKEVILKEATIISRNYGYLGYSDIASDERFPYKKDFSIKFDIEIYKMRQSGEIDSIVNRFVNAGAVSSIAEDK